MNDAVNPFIAKSTGFWKFPRLVQIFSGVLNWNSSHAVIGMVSSACVVPVCWLIRKPNVADMAAMVTNIKRVLSINYLYGLKDFKTFSTDQFIQWIFR